MGIPNTLLKLLYRDVKLSPRPDRTFSRPDALARIRHLQLRPQGPTRPPPRAARAAPAPAASVMKDTELVCSWHIDVGGVLRQCLRPAVRGAGTAAAAPRPDAPHPGVCA